MDTETLTKKEFQALRYIRNELVHGSHPPSIRAIMAKLGYNSPRAAAYIVEKLEAKGFIARDKRGSVRLKKDLPEHEMHAQTIEIPLVGCAPCGTPVFAEENIEAMIPVSTQLARRSHRYFLLRAIGDSMDQAGIRDRNLVLVRQQSTAENGDRVVALIDGEATIKEFHRTVNAIVLKPRSSNKRHQPIILTNNFRVLGVVQSTIEL